MEENWELTTKPSQVMREVLIIPKPGLGMLALFLGGLVLAGLLLLAAAGLRNPFLILLAVPLGLVCLFGLIGLFTVSPNEAKVLQLFGNYQHTAQIAEHLKTEIQERLVQAGVQVLEARISHLAYAPEIAHAMLQRQQASAVIAARQKIVEGAVGMVEMALERLSHQKIVDLDNEKKAAMVSNLLVVLCSDRGTQPVVSAGK